MQQVVTGSSPEPAPHGSIPLRAAPRHMGQVRPALPGVGDQVRTLDGVQQAGREVTQTSAEDIVHGQYEIFV